jgi:peptide/nickel transport system permease protein
MSSIPADDPRLATPAAPGPADYEVALQSLNQWQLAWRRFRRHRLAMVGAVIFTLMVFLAIFGPIIWPYDPLALRGDLPGPEGFSPLEMPPMGSDGGGRSVWVLVANGARLSMIIGITTMLIA